MTQEHKRMQPRTIEITSDVVVKKLRLQPDVIYTNQEIRVLLGVDERLIRKYRDDGLLSYHRVGDKYWYTGTDIFDFLERSRIPAFA